ASPRQGNALQRLRGSDSETDAHRFRIRYRANWATGFDGFRLTRWTTLLQDWGWLWRLAFSWVWSADGVSVTLPTGAVRPAFAPSACRGCWAASLPRSQPPWTQAPY